MEIENINSKRILKKQDMEHLDLDDTNENVVIVTAQELPPQQNDIVNYENMQKMQNYRIQEDTWHILQLYQPFIKFQTKKQENQEEEEVNFSIDTWYRYIMNKIIFYWYVNYNARLKLEISNAYKTPKTAIDKKISAFISTSEVIVKSHSKRKKNFSCFTYSKSTIDRVYSNDKSLTFYGRFCKVLKVWFIFYVEKCRWYVSFTKPSKIKIEELINENNINWMATVFLMYIHEHICFDYNSINAAADNYPFNAKDESSYIIHSRLSLIQKAVIDKFYADRQSLFNIGYILGNKEFEFGVKNFIQKYCKTMKEVTDPFPHDNHHRLLNDINIEESNYTYWDVNNFLYVFSNTKLEKSWDFNITNYNDIQNNSENYLKKKELDMQITYFLTILFFKEISVWNRVILTMNNIEKIYNIPEDLFGENEIKQEITIDVNTLGIDTYFDMFAAFYKNFFFYQENIDRNTLYSISKHYRYNVLEVYYKFKIYKLEMHNILKIEGFIIDEINKIIVRASNKGVSASIYIFDIYLLIRLFQTTSKLIDQNSKLQFSTIIYNKIQNIATSSFLSAAKYLLNIIKNITTKINEVMKNNLKKKDIYEIISSLNWEEIYQENKTVENLLLPTEIDLFLDYNIFINMELSKKIIVDIYNTAEKKTDSQNNLENKVNSQANPTLIENNKTFKALEIIKKIDDNIIYTNSNYIIHKDHINEISESTISSLFSEINTIKRKIWSNDLININLLDIYFLLYRYLDIIKHIDRNKTTHAFHNYLLYFNSTKLTDFYYETLSDLLFSHNKHGKNTIWEKMYEKIYLQLSFNVYSIEKILIILKAITNLEEKEMEKHHYLPVKKNNVVNAILEMVSKFNYESGNFEDIYNTINDQNIEILYIDLRNDKKKDEYGKYIKIIVYDWVY